MFWIELLVSDDEGEKRYSFARTGRHLQHALDQHILGKVHTMSSSIERPLQIRYISQLLWIDPIVREYDL